MTQKEGEYMATALTRLTFVVTKEMEPRLDSAKKSRFYNRTQSDMILELVLAGLDALDEKAAADRTGRVNIIRPVDEGRESVGIYQHEG